MNRRALVDEIATSVSRNPDALVSLARLKTQDEYSYMHSVAVCALMVSLGRTLGLPEADCRLAGMAGLMLGSEDYSASLGIDPEGGGLDMPAAQIAAAAAARMRGCTGCCGAAMGISRRRPRSLEDPRRTAARPRAGTRRP